jgi:hypothetical protein
MPLWAGVVKLTCADSLSTGLDHRHGVAGRRVEEAEDFGLDHAGGAVDLAQLLGGVDEDEVATLAEGVAVAHEDRLERFLDGDAVQVGGDGSFNFLAGDNVFLRLRREHA